ncbi:MAG: hypothetical protein KAU01_11980 [Candidatus Cloacimonetes bacterium]|nr:hypothetical protein [Candidatus Cloacimonadota bacterium]
MSEEIKNINLFETDGEWIYLVPIKNLKLTKFVNKEIKIDRVTFIEKNKLFRTRKKFSIYKKFSEFRSVLFNDFFEYDTYAIMHFTGKPKNNENYCIRTINRELALLTFSQLGFSKRRFYSSPIIANASTIGMIRNIYINNKLEVNFERGFLKGKYSKLILDYNWKKYIGRTFLILIKIIQCRIELNSSWRKKIIKSAILIGQSLCSIEIHKSFLWNCIALEILLVEQNDNTQKALVERIESFIGWIYKWQTLKYESRLKEVYKKRCAFVHRGRFENITISDVLFIDDILFDVFRNILEHIELFPDKKSIIDFSEKVKAQHLLGIKTSIKTQNI